MTAICIEEDEDRQGMIVRMAVSGSAIAYAENGLRQICAILEAASQRGKGALDESERIPIADSMKKRQKTLM